MTAASVISLQVLHALFDNARVPMTLVDLARNYGEHNAVMAGLRHRAGSVITMDDDLQILREVQRLLAFSQRAASKWSIPTDHKRHPMWRNFASRFCEPGREFRPRQAQRPVSFSFRCMSAFRGTRSQSL